MTDKIQTVLTLLILYSSILTAQVQVSKEPHHKNVLENKYIRLLDVWIKPGDTTLFHMHSTPSLFLFLTDTYAGSQIMWGRNGQKARMKWAKHPTGLSLTIPSCTVWVILTLLYFMLTILNCYHHTNPQCQLNLYHLPYSLRTKKQLLINSPNLH